MRSIWLDSPDSMCFKVTPYSMLLSDMFCSHLEVVQKEKIGCKSRMKEESC